MAMVETPTNTQQQNISSYTKGDQSAAILLLALGEEFGKPLWEHMDDEEITQISQVMAKLGKVTTDQVEALLARFISDMSISGAVMGNLDSTEALLRQFLPQDRVNNIMEGIRGPAGRNMWGKTLQCSSPCFGQLFKE